MEGGEKMSFNHGTKHLSGQQQAIIRQREANEKLLKEQKEKKEKVTEVEIEEETEIKKTESE